MSLFVGIDVSSSDLKVRILDDQGNEPMKQLRALNNQPGCQQIVQYLLMACAQENPQRLVIGLEATCVYSWPLQMFLAENMGSRGRFGVKGTFCLPAPFMI